MEKVAEGAEDYYSGEGEAEGQWFGALAEDFGLEGTVPAEGLTPMLTARNPADGEPLGLRAVGGRGAVPGFDLTFSIPKSASLLWALGDVDTSAAISVALDRSFEVAIDYLQREACWTRRGAEAEFVRGAGFLGAAYRHRTSRNGDPQFHVHGLIANATRSPDGKWTRLHHPSIYQHAKTAGYIFEAHFRHELTQSLGLSWREVCNGIAEIEGFEDSHLRAFSTRRREILEAAGPDASARARQIANLATRSIKEEGVTSRTLRERWRLKAREIGLDVAGIGRGLVPGASAVTAPPSFEQVGGAVTAGVSHFDRGQAIQAVAGLAREGMAGAEVERVADAFLASEQVVALGTGPKDERFTTRRIWELEREALASVARMRAEGPRPAGLPAAERTIVARPTLKADQRRMIRRLLAERSGIAVVIGEAGSGKTYAIAAAAEGWAAAGIELRAAAPTWRAANAMRAEGLSAQSIASLLAELDRDPPGEGLTMGSVLLVDEAGMVDSATLARLIAHVRAVDAKLVLIGDGEQLAEIEAGGLFRAIAERGEPIHLEEVIRHRHEVEREGARMIRAGEGREALGLYRSEERVVIAPDAEARREAMVSDWHEAFEAGADAAMVAKRNAEVELLNARARQRLKEAGRLGGEEIEVGDARFAAGDLVITRVNDRRQDIYNRERWRVAEVDAGQRRVVLEGVDQARSVQVGADYLARTNPHGEAPALQHAYAITTYSAQGTTLDRAYVAADPSMDKQELYVATSRSREETFIYATPEIQASREGYAPRSFDERGALAHIGDAAVRDRAQRAAHDVAQMRRLPGQELGRLQRELRRTVHREAGAQRHREELMDRVRCDIEFLDGMDAQRRRARNLPRKLRRSELERIDRTEAETRAWVECRRDEAAKLPVPSKVPGRELEAVEEVLGERVKLALVAARLASPPYITAELGERPADTAKARLWDRGVSAIERYRHENGVTDRSSTFGAEPRDRSARDLRQLEMLRSQRLARQLRQQQELRLGRQLRQGLGIEL